MELLEELRLIDQVVERLGMMHPQVSAETIGATVGAAHARFDGLRVRRSVPRIVEEMANTALCERIPT